MIADLGADFPIAWHHDSSMSDTRSYPKMWSSTRWNRSLTFVDSHEDSWRFLATSDTSTRIEITHTSGRPAEKATRPRCDQGNALIDEGAKVGTKG